MIKQLVSAALLGAIALGTVPASAGTYVSGPLPSEFGGGFLPPDPAVLKNLQTAAKLSAKFAASIDKCYSKGVENLSKGRPSNLLPCLFDERTGVIVRFVTSIARINNRPPGLPPCYDLEGPGVAVYEHFSARSPQLFCQE